MNLHGTTVRSAASGWALTVFAVGLATGVPPLTWVAAGCMALLPPLVIARLWRDLVPSMAQTMPIALREQP